MTLPHGYMPCRCLRDFWKQTVVMYLNGHLPPDFFARTNAWLQRGEGYRKQVEPVDIANYYRRQLWKHHPVGQQHYLESDNRPDTYVFLESKWKQEHEEGYPFESSVESAVIEAANVQKGINE